MNSYANAAYPIHTFPVSYPAPAKVPIPYLPYAPVIQPTIAPVVVATTVKEEKSKGATVSAPVVNTVSAPIGATVAAPLVSIPVGAYSSFTAPYMAYGGYASAFPVAI